MTYWIISNNGSWFHRYLFVTIIDLDFNKCFFLHRMKFSIFICRLRYHILCNVYYVVNPFLKFWDHWIRVFKDGWLILSIIRSTCIRQQHIILRIFHFTCRLVSQLCISIIAAYLVLNIRWKYFSFDLASSISLIVGIICIQIPQIITQ